jgi:hypothetical protein
MSQTYRLHARPAVVSRAPTLSENFESGPSRRCRVPTDSTSSEEQMEIDAFWGGGARPALRPDGGRNLFQKKNDSLLPVSACAGGDCESERGTATVGISTPVRARATGDGIVAWGGDCALGVAVVGTQTAQSRETGRAVRFGGGPSPGEPSHGLGWGTSTEPQVGKGVTSLLGSTLPCQGSRALCRLIFPLRPLQSVGKGRGF